MHIYIHIPFCDSKCGYCAFFSKIDSQGLIPAYFKSLQEDIKYFLEKYNVKTISSIFIGGGTPNLVDYKYYDNIFSFLMPLCAKDVEITSESNPNLLTDKWLAHLKSLGLNRLSMGVQSFYEDKLELLQRNHSQKHIYKSFDIAKKYLDNVSIDLIYDCILDSEKRLEKELRLALNLDFTHLSAYSLSIDKDSIFEKNRQDKCLKNSLSSFVRDFLLKNGAIQYEVSNFSFKYKCKHNLGYWSGDEYIGIGAGSVGRIGNTRFFAPKDLQKYINNPTYREKEILSKQNIDFEAIFLGLRSEVGVRESLLKKDKLDMLLDSKICYKKDEIVYATDYLLADEITLFLS